MKYFIGLDKFLYITVVCEIKTQFLIAYNIKSAMTQNWADSQWFNPSSGGWSNESAGFDIPIDDFEQPDQAHENYFSPQQPQSQSMYNPPKSSTFGFVPPSDFPNVSATQSGGNMDYSYWANKEAPTGKNSTFSRCQNNEISHIFNT